MADARVRLCALGAPGLRDGYRSPLGGSTLFAHTDGDGAFSFGPDEATSPLVLLVDAEGAAPAAIALGVLDPAVGHAPVSVDLGAGVTVSGLVRHADGTPQPRAVVALHHEWVGARTAVAGADGRFEFAHVMPGRYELRPAEQRLTPGSHSFRALVDAPTQAASWSNLVVEDADVSQDLVLDRGTVAGHLADPRTDFRGFSAELVLPHDGQPVGPRVELTADGRFVLASFAVGRHRLRVRAPGGAFGELEFTCDIDLVPGRIEVGCAPALGPCRVELPNAAPGERFDLWRRQGPWTFRTPLPATSDAGRILVPLTASGDAMLRRLRRGGVDTIRVEHIEVER